MIKCLSLKRREIGLIFSIVGIVLIIFGLAVYLNGPSKSNTIFWERSEEVTENVSPNSFFAYPCRAAIPSGGQSLILPSHANASITTDEGAVKAYFLSENIYSLLKEDARFSTEIEEFRIDLHGVNWTLYPDVVYYIVLFNMSNETLTANIKVSNFYAVQVFDYEAAFTGLKIGLFGGILFAASFPFGNVLNELLRNGLKAQIFPEKDKYPRRSGSEVFIIWTLLGIFTSLTTFGVYSQINKVPAALGDIPQPIIPLVQDVLIRLGLYLIFTTAVGLTILYVAMFIHSILAGFLYWWFGIRRNRIYDQELGQRCYSLWLHKMKSPQSLSVYLFTVLLVLIVWWFKTENILIPMLATVTPLTLLGAYNLSLSYRDLCQNIEDFERMKFFIYVEILTGLLIASLFPTMLFWSWNLLLNTIYAKTVGSSTLFIVAPQIGQGFQESYVSFILDFINGIKDNLRWMSIGMVIILAQVPSLFYAMHPTETRKFRNRVIEDIRNFFLSFIPVQLILTICQQSLSTATFVSIAISVAMSVLKTCVNTSWKSIVMKTRVCPQCKKELPSISKEMIFCPYCGEKLIKE